MSVTVTCGGSLFACGCAEQHLVMMLPRSFNCAATTMAFDWSTTGTFSTQGSPALEVSFPGAGYFLGSPYVGHSTCAPTLGNTFPSPPHVTTGHNTIPLALLVTSADGTCNGVFTSVDVQMLCYSCGASFTLTLSNLSFQ
jgi:hypothetical protein